MNLFDRLALRFGEGAASAPGGADAAPVPEASDDPGFEAHDQRSAAVEIAAGYISRAFAMAKAEGDGAEFFDADVLHRAGRDLMLRGDSVWMRTSAGLRWIPSFGTITWPPEHYDIAGKVVEARFVIHAAYARSFLTGRGRSPITEAATLVASSAGFARMLQHESQSSVGYVVPVPSLDDTEDAEGNPVGVKEISGDFRKLQGRYALVESAEGGWGDAGAATADYEIKRLGSVVPESNLKSYLEYEQLVMLLCGMPVGLLRGAGAAELRESWRIFLHGTISPLARLFEAACARAELPVKFNFDDLYASDIGGRARAFGQLRRGDMPIADAAKATGFSTGERS